MSCLMGPLARFMIPLLSSDGRCAAAHVWCSDAGVANIGIMRDEEGNYLAYAKRPIKQGEEVRSITSHAVRA